MRKFILVLLQFSVLHYADAFCVSTFQALKGRINGSPIINICPGSTIKFNSILRLRKSNVIFQCGEDDDGGGEGCIFEPTNNHEDRLLTVTVSGSGVKFKGITFQNVKSSVIHISQQENKVTKALFDTCQFLNNQSATDRSTGVVYVTSGDGSVDFVDCFFTGNTAVNGVIYSNGPTININACMFYNNQVSPIVLDNRGNAKLHVANSCFEDNVGKYMVHIESLYDTIQATLDNNHGNGNVSRGGCKGVYNGKSRKCLQFDEGTCRVTAPSSVPTTTVAPSSAPSFVPTIRPSQSKMPSDFPTLLDSSRPTGSPSTSSPTLTAEPTPFPTMSRSSRPSATPSPSVSVKPTSFSESLYYYYYYPTVSPKPSSSPSSSPIETPKATPKGSINDDSGGSGGRNSMQKVLLFSITFLVTIFIV